MSGGFSDSIGLCGTQQDFGGLGITLIPDPASDTKGSWISIGTVTNGCSAFMLKLLYGNGGGSDSAISVDIGIGASSGVVFSIIDNIGITINAGGTFSGGIFQHLIPISFPPGTQIWGRSSANAASFTGGIVCWLTPFENSFSGVEYTGIETLGWTATGQGTVITPGPSLTGTKGSYSLIGTSTVDYAGFLVAFNLLPTDGESASMNDIAIGASGLQKIIWPDIYMYIGGGESPINTEFMPVSVPSGSQFWCRGANIQTFNFGVTIYGVF